MIVCNNVDFGSRDNIFRFIDCFVIRLKGKIYRILEGVEFIVIKVNFR